MRLIIIRHGQTPANVLGRLDTAHPGPGLTALGERQAEAVPLGVATVLEGLPSPRATVGPDPADQHGAAAERELTRRLGEVLSAVDQVWVSPLVRTTLTGQPLTTLLGITPTVLPGLAEIEAGDLEGSTAMPDLLAFRDTVTAWAQGDLGRRMPGAGDGTAFFDRYDGAISEIRRSGAQTAVVISHGAAIRTWVAARSANPVAFVPALQHMENTSAALLESATGAGAGSWQISRWDPHPIGGEHLLDDRAIDPTAKS